MAIPAIAQYKYEKESRMKTNEVPKRALEMIQSFKTSTVKWYLEEGLTTKTVEAKFKKNKKKYSVEFDLDGNLQDIEIDLDLKEIEKSTLDIIQIQLKKKFTLYKIQKAQLHFSKDLERVVRKLEKEETIFNDRPEFELILIGKVKKETAIYELLFSETGEILNESKIILTNTSHLEN